jgi:putative FmdB family regulatory protein
MPIYEYRCEHCGHELEKLQRMSDAPLRDCPECGQPQLRRLVSAAGFRLKGGGWYETDFKKDNRRNLADGGKDSAAKDGSGTTGSGKDGAATDKKAGAETKPAASKTTGKNGGQASAA